METKYTEADFEQLSWHDCHIWGMTFCASDPEDDWTSEVVFDIDFIVEWICGKGGDCDFRVAPARLEFHGVTDPRININWGASGFQTALYGASIDRIEQERVLVQKVYLDRPYYSWRILLGMPEGSEIAFGAVGFTQTLLAEPVRTSIQHLSRRERNGLIGP